MYVVIVGGGRVGRDIAELLLPEGHDVVILDTNDETCNLLTREYDALVIKGDGTDIEYLKEAGVNKADALLAVTGDDKVNLIVCQLAQKLFNVPKVVGRVNDPKNEDVFSTLEIKATVSTTRASALYIKNEITEEKTVLTIAGGQAEIIELDIKKHSPVANTKIKNAGFPKGVHVLSILRGDKTIFPDENSILRPRDTVTILARTNAVAEVKEIINGKKRFKFGI